LRRQGNHRPSRPRPQLNSLFESRSPILPTLIEVILSDPLTKCHWCANIETTNERGLLFHSSGRGRGPAEVASRTASSETPHSRVLVLWLLYGLFCTFPLVLSVPTNAEDVWSRWSRSGDIWPAKGYAADDSNHAARPRVTAAEGVRYSEIQCFDPIGRSRTEGNVSYNPDGCTRVRVLASQRSTSTKQTR
jgi:hypothetical protein